MFLHGFAKNERDNIDDDELETLREIGAAWLEAKPEQFEDAMETGILEEIAYVGER